jgi:hypothetical protein
MPGCLTRPQQNFQTSGCSIWARLRANRLSISVFETCEDIVARCCDAWNFFANDSATVRSITTREYAKTVKD